MADFFLGLILMVVGPIVGGLVLTKLWAWFIVPQFGVKPLSIPQALGCIVGMLTYQFCEQSKEIQEMSSWGKLLYGIMHSLICLFFGWVYHLFL